MRTREYPVLSEDDRETVDRLALGLSDGTARILGYLLRRYETPEFADEPATRLEIRVGTGASRDVVSKALAAFKERGLVTETTVPTEQGRPPQAWYPRDGVEETMSSVYRDHAGDLLRQSVAVAVDCRPTESRGMDLDSTDLHLTEPQSTGPRPTDADPDGRDDRRLTVGLNWFSNPLHAPLFGGTAEGHYSTYGLDVSLRRFKGSGSALDGLLTDDADVVVAGAASVVRRWTGGEPLVPLAPLVQRAKTVLYTTPETFGERLNSVEQLRGRRVAMPVGSETGLLGRLLLSQSNVLDDVTVVDVTGEEREVLRAGDADVVTGTARDVREFEAAGESIDALPVAGHFPIYGPTLVTTERTVPRRERTLVAFLAGTLAGAGEAISNPERVLHAIRDHEGRLDDVRDPRAATDELRAGGTVEDYGWGWHESDGWRRLETALRQAGLLVESPRTE